MMAGTEEIAECPLLPRENVMPMSTEWTFFKANAEMREKAMLWAESEKSIGEMDATAAELLWEEKRQLLEQSRKQMLLRLDEVKQSVEETRDNVKRMAPCPEKDQFLQDCEDLMDRLKTEFEEPLKDLEWQAKEVESQVRIRCVYRKIQAEYRGDLLQNLGIDADEACAMTTIPQPENWDSWKSTSIAEGQRKFNAIFTGAFSSEESQKQRVRERELDLIRLILECNDRHGMDAKVARLAAYSLALLRTVDRSSDKISRREEEIMKCDNTLQYGKVTAKDVEEFIARLSAEVGA